MSTTGNNQKVNSRLAELDSESQRIIDTYLAQVITDATSPLLKTLREQLRKVRIEQWQLAG